MAGRLTPEQREEGRRLLKACKESRDDRNFSTPRYNAARAKLCDWLFTYSDALLADHEEISRAAVREFAEAVFAEYREMAALCPNTPAAPNQQGYLSAAKMIREQAAARGVTLEKP